MTKSRYRLIIGRGEGCAHVDAVSPFLVSLFPDLGEGDHDDGSDDGSRTLVLSTDSYPMSSEATRASAPSKVRIIQY